MAAAYTETFRPPDTSFDTEGLLIEQYALLCEDVKNPDHPPQTYRLLGKLAADVEWLWLQRSLYQHTAEQMEAAEPGEDILELQHVASKSDLDLYLRSRV